MSSDNFKSHQTKDGNKVTARMSSSPNLVLAANKGQLIDQQNTQSPETHKTITPPKKQ